MKKILIITPCILPVPAVDGGGVESLITRIINDNEKNGSIAIDLYSIADLQYDSLKFLKTSIIQIKQSKISFFLDRVIDKLIRLLKIQDAYRLLDNIIISKLLKEIEQGKKYDAIIVENQLSIMSKLLDNREKILESVLYFHMHNDVDAYRSPRAIKIAGKNGVRFIAVSEYIKNQILGTSEDTVVDVLYNGIDLSVFDKSNSNENKAIEFLYAGRIIPEKGVAELVEAFKRIANEKVKLKIVGFSGDNKKYEEKIRKQCENSNIKCLDKIDNTKLANLYHEADVIVMPTLNNEPFGLVALEAMACGKPLITTNSGGLSEVVGDCAYLIDRENIVEDLVVAIKDLQNAELRQVLSEKAYARTREIRDFDIQNYYSNFRNMIETTEVVNYPLISVIVPVYNVSRYLEQCIDSILNQSYNNIEIILIDDGSTDSSGDICDRYSQKRYNNKMVEISHIGHCGVSVARNIGLDSARGEYIFFVDSDDYISENTILDLYRDIVVHDSDIAACGINKVFEDGRIELFTSQDAGVFCGREIVKQSISTNNICTVAWNKLYKADLWKDIRFPAGMLHEDEGTTYKVLYRANRVSYNPAQYYQYRQNEQGIMSGNVNKRFEDYCLLIREKYTFFQQNNDIVIMDMIFIDYLEHLKYFYRNYSKELNGDLIVSEYLRVFREYENPRGIGFKKWFSLNLWKVVHF